MLQAEIDAYTGEMEVIGSAYEEMQSKSSALLQQVLERDDRLNTLATEQAQEKHKAQAQAEEALRAVAAKQAILQQASANQDRVNALESSNQVI